MFDHVTIRVSGIDASSRFYELALAPLGLREPSVGGHFVEWNDLSISQARNDKPVTRNLHLALVAQSRAVVDEWWRVMTAAGYTDEGPPGVRPDYHADYYGAFVLDPDGNSVEVVYHGRRRKGDEVIDHLWVRVADLDATKRFYETIAPVVDIRIAGERRERFHIATANRSAAFVHDGGPLTENLHLAFPAPDNATVDEFHRVAVSAGYRDNGAPGERRYHAGYYGAFALDPDGHNVEAVCHNREG